MQSQDWPYAFTAPSPTCMPAYIKGILGIGKNCHVKIWEKVCGIFLLPMGSRSRVLYTGAIQPNEETLGGPLMEIKGA